MPSYLIDISRGAHTLVHFPVPTRLDFRCDHASPTSTSMARVAANSVKSSVRPAYRTVRYSTPGGTSDLATMVSVKLAVCFDCRSFRLSQAAVKDERNLASLAADGHQNNKQVRRTAGRLRT